LKALAGETVLDVIDVSIEISTYNRKDVLQMVLERLARQTYPAERFEVVLSDDGSADGLPELVDALTPGLPFAVRVLRSEHRGPGHAHNRGIRACRGEVVIMLAADVLPVPELVEEHVRSHRENPLPNAVVAGRLTQSRDLPDNGVQRGFNELTEEIFSNRSGKVKHGGFLVSNLSFKKSFMLEHGMFQEWPPASGEDIELGYRLARNGMALLSNPKALGYHHHEETIASIARRAYLMGYNSHYLAAHVDDSWVKARFGGTQIGDGLRAYAKTRLKGLLRPVVVNRVTTSLLVVPLIRMAAPAKALSPLVTLLCRRLSAYYFARGMSDHRHRRSFDLSLTEL
jgi:glycosyltransferase involved in cell wall biosynthesis